MKKKKSQGDIHLRGTIKFEDIDVQQEDVLDDLGTMLDAVRGHEVDGATDPFMPALSVDYDPRATVAQQVSAELIERAKGLQEKPSFPPPIPAEKEEQMAASEGWTKRHGTVSKRGILAIYVVDSGFEPGDKLEVLIRKKP